MKALTVIIAAFILAFGSVAIPRSANLDRISSATGSSGRDIADGKSIDWSWLGQLGEGASAGQRHRPEF